MIRKATRKIARTMGDYFAPFYVRDCHGTFQACWSMASAEAWLPACSARAVITARYYGGEVVSRRLQGV